MAQKNSFSALVDDTIGFLKQSRDEGVQRVSISPESLEKLKNLAAPRRRKPSGMTLADLREHIGDCQRCAIAKDRNKLVFGVGSETADLVFVGEAPCTDEDRQGEPFVGRAGKLLTRMIKKMGFERDQVYIANILKCRPPGNRDPLPDEIANCEEFLIKQLEIIQPKVIVALGKYAAQTLLRSDTPIRRMRGQLMEYHGIPLMPTYHPSYLLRNASKRWDVWDDMQIVLELLGRK